MPSPPHTPAHRRGAPVRHAVLRATAELLLTEGLAGTRIADIAARAGVHETSIYRRWGTRNNLIAEALSSHLDNELPLPDTGSTREDLTAFFTALAEFLTTPAGRSMTSLSLARPDSEDPIDLARDRFWDMRLTRASILVRRGIDRGDIRSEIDPQLILEAVAGPLHLHILLRNQPADRDYVSSLIDLTLDGARPR